MGLIGGAPVCIYIQYGLAGNNVLAIKQQMGKT